MKKLLVLVTLLTATIGFSQELERKIPATASAVVSINGNHLLDLISIEELNNNLVGKQILEGTNRRRDENNKLSSLSDFGFSLDSKAYYFLQTSDSITYNCFLIKLNNKKQFESLLSESKRKDITTKNGYSVKKGWGDITFWNDNTLLLVSATPDYDYIQENEARLALEDESTYKTKRRVGLTWAEAYGLQLLKSKRKKTSIISNSSYLTAKDDKADMVIWLANYNELIASSMKSLQSILHLSNYTKDTPISSGFSTLVSKLYFEKNSIRLDSKVKVEDAWVDTYQKIYDNKIDSRFFNYFNQNKALAYASIAADTKSILDAYPQIIKNMYGNASPKYSDEIAVAADLTSIFMDEEAIGKLVTGDILFILNDLTMKEVEYTTYVYDEDYNSKEVTKTKQEPSPDFTVLIGSENSEMINKFAKLGVKHHVLNQTANYYRFETPKSVPFQTYAMMKDGVLVLTTSQEQISAIAVDKFKAKTGKHQAIINNNASVFYINSEAILNAIPTDSFGKSGVERFNYLKNNGLGEIFIKSKLVGNQFETVMTIDTPHAKQNSLKYIFDFIEEIAKLK